MKKLILFAVFTAVASLCSMTAQDTTRYGDSWLMFAPKPGQMTSWGANGCALQNTSVTLGPDSPYSCLRPELIPVALMENPALTTNYECLTVVNYNENHYSYTPGLLPASIGKDCEM